MQADKSWDFKKGKRQRYDLHSLLIHEIGFPPRVSGRVRRKTFGGLLSGLVKVTHIYFRHGVN